METKKKKSFFLGGNLNSKAFLAKNTQWKNAKQRKILEKQKNKKQMTNAGMKHDFRLKH